MSLRFNVAPIIHFDEDTETGTLRVEAIARHAGVLRYQNFDGTHRYEFVPPELNNGRNPDGKPWVAQLAGATATNEHPNRLIKNDTALKEQVQVGEVEPEIEVYQDGRVKVFLNVWDSKTIDEIKRGDKRGISLGYECAVEKTDGVWKGQRFDARQTLPISVDHAAIVRNPRAPEALIRSYTHADSEDGYIDIAWHCDTDDRLDSLVDDVAALLERRDMCGGKVYSGKKRKKKQKPIALMDALETYIGDAQMNSLVIGGNEYRLDSGAVDAIVSALSQHWDAKGGGSKVCPGGYKIPKNKNCRKGNAMEAKKSADVAAKNQARTAALRAKYGKTATEQMQSAIKKATFSKGEVGVAARSVARSAGSRQGLPSEVKVKKAQPKGGTRNPKNIGKAPVGKSPFSEATPKQSKGAATRKEKQSLDKIASKKSTTDKKYTDIMNKSFDLESKGGQAKRVAENVQRSAWGRTSSSFSDNIPEVRRAKAKSISKAKARNAKRKAKKKTDSYAADYGSRIYTRA